MSLLSSSRPYRARINETTIGDRTIISAVTDKKIVVLNLVLTVASGNTVTWKSSSSVISGPISESYTAGDSHAGILETGDNEALVLNLGTTDQVSGYLTYALVP